MRGRRLPEGPHEAIDRRAQVSFELDGRALQAYEGDTIGSAMAADGVTITGRSFKYHRPRGLLCMEGACPNCLVGVDGIPNVRACVTPVREGMKVARQNAWPSVERDVKGLIDRFSFLLPPGFYYKIFHRPRILWTTVEPIMRQMAGLGKVPSEEDHGHRPRISLHPDVLVVGGGPAGLAAATEAARGGVRAMLIEQRHDLGGHLRGSVATAATRESDLAGLPGHEVAGRLAATALETGVEVLTATPAFGVFDGPVVGAVGGDALYRIRARHVVFATGALEQPAVFPNNDLPGVMLGTAVDRLLNLYRVLPGRKAVVLTAGAQGYATAASLREAGSSATVVDLRPVPAGPEVDAFRSSGGSVIPGSTIRRAEGRRHVSAALVGPLGGPGERRLECDLLALSGVVAPSTNLLAQAGGRVEFDEGAQAFLPVELPEWLHAAGAAAGARSLDVALAQGRLAGLEAAAAAGGSVDPARLDELRARATDLGEPMVLPPETGEGDGKEIACLCMDVTTKELKTAVGEGFDSMELLKRYTTLSMGPCQGKACMLASARLCGKATGRSLAETGITTARAPWTPVPLGVLASHKRVPRKETSIHDRHAALGATFMWAGDWRRPHHYIDPADEVRAVHERVGLIDVGTLGKFRVKGPQAVELLERLYPNRFADLKVGRVRYGVMCNDVGVILDDGTVARLGEDEFFVTVTTGNTAAIDRWITWWNADWNLDAQVLNVTAAYAAVNLAGPRSRDVMRRLTDMDVSAEGWPYMAARRGEVAGVPVLAMRIGFVGELGYEIHFPSAYGEYLWERIMDAGAEFDIQPFGLEAQRILRLEKGHILVGQDTDAESDPYEAGLSWMVKLDKPDFLGRTALLELGDREPKERLVGFVADPSIIPPEGSAIVRGGKWVGRVTSARRSEATGRVVGLAWVPSDMAEEGTGVDIKHNGSRLHATVKRPPFYDAEGARLKG